MDGRGQLTARDDMSGAHVPIGCAAVVALAVGALVLVVCASFVYVIAYAAVGG